MKVVIHASEKIAVGMACCFISLNKRTIKSKKEFIKELKIYIEMYGESCVDDHETEVTEEEHELANETVLKYFN